MAKKSRTEKLPGGNGAASAAAAEDVSLEAVPKPKRKKAVPKKKASGAISPTTKKKAPQATAIPEPSDDEIRVRAYFIAERRIKLSLQGDSDRDWIEARRQLLEEARRRAS